MERLRGPWSLSTRLTKSCPELRAFFERFARGANVAGRITGSGVGLTIVRQIVEQHGGTVSVSSTVGRGSTFTIKLPLATLPAALTAAN